jgi:hypothetical protein
MIPQRLHMSIPRFQAIIIAQSFSSHQHVEYGVLGFPSLKSASQTIVKSYKEQ